MSKCRVMNDLKIQLINNNIYNYYHSYYFLIKLSPTSMETCHLSLHSSLYALRYL